MSGLCDVTTGLKEGSGLIFEIGGLGGPGGLTIQSAAPTPPTSFFLLEDGTSYLLLEDGASKLGLES